MKAVEGILLPKNLHFASTRLYEKIYIRYLGVEKTSAFVPLLHIGLQLFMPAYQDLARYLRSISSFLIAFYFLGTKL